MFNTNETDHEPGRREKPEAINPTAQRLHITLEAAGVFILRTVQAFTPTMFVEAVELRDQVWYDVYACYRDGLGWYVKVGETESGLVVISHHEPDHSVARPDGVIIYATDPSAAGGFDSGRATGRESR